MTANIESVHSEKSRSTGEHQSRSNRALEFALSQELLEKLGADLIKAGKGELANYSFIDAWRKEKKGVGQIVIDCSKVKPQKVFDQLAQTEKVGTGYEMASRDFHAELAYTMGMALEMVAQMLEYVATKPRFRPEDPELTALLEEQQRKMSSGTRVGSEVFGDAHLRIYRMMDLLAQSLSLQKCTLILTNTQSIPSYAEDSVRSLLGRARTGQHETPVLFIAREKSVDDVPNKVTELKARLGKNTNPEYKKALEDLSKALDWYLQTRFLKQELRKHPRNEREMEKAILLQMDVIKGKGYTFFDLDEEFGVMSEDEVKQIKARLFE